MLQHAVPQAMLTPETQVMMQWFSAYYTAFPEHSDINMDELATLVRLRSGNSTPEQIGITLHLVDMLRAEVSNSTLQGITAQLVELDLSGKVGALVTQYNNGEEIDLAYEVLMLAQGARRQMMEGVKASWENRDIMDLLAEDADEGGLQWISFAPLQRALKGLQIGDNVGVAAPTDKGKTSLLCRLAVDMQSQGKVLYPGRPTLYLVNEGTAARITTRLYQTAAGLTREEMWALGGDKLREHYINAVGGLDMIRVVNVHGKNMAQVANIIDRHNPHLVITDMTGRIRAASNKGGAMNDIGQLEEVWNDFREQAVLLEFAHMGTIQVSAEGFDMLHPPLSALQNSKTGIQTTLDLALIMGAYNNLAQANIRGIHTPKNKLGRSGQNSQVQFECVFDPKINQWRTGQ